MSMLENRENGKLDERKERKTIRNKPVNEEVVNRIAQSYSILKSEIIAQDNFYEDVFQDTIILLSSDKDAVKARSKGQLIAYFKKRYNMILYRNKMQKKERKEVEYADYKKNKEETEE